MTPPKKPEWFELRDNDNNSPRPETKRFSRGALLAIPFLIVGIGAVAAQIGEESPVETAKIVSTATATPDAAVITPDVPSTPSDVPSIATLPTKPRGGDDDDDHEGFKPRRPHHGEERHDFDDDDEFEGDDD